MPKDSILLPDGELASMQSEVPALDNMPKPTEGEESYADEMTIHILCPSDEPVPNIGIYPDPSDYAALASSTDDKSVLCSFILDSYQSPLWIYTIKKYRYKSFYKHYMAQN